MTVKSYLFFFVLFLLFPLIIIGQESTANSFLQKSNTGQLLLTQQGASHFSRLALDCIQKEYPNNINHVLRDSSMLTEPMELHPTFYGCYDWHSSVHGHWMLARLLKQFPNLPEGAEIRNKFNQNITPENIQVEVAYLDKANKSWERMYGWSWLLKLGEELYTWEDVDARKWSRILAPLLEKVVQRYEQFLPVQRYPIRTGVHPNTAFGLTFAWDYAETTGGQEFQKLIETAAKRYYVNDHSCPADWEPSGEDFLSGCLVEADLMRRILPPKEYNQWFKYFLPKDKLLAVARPVDVSDRSDPKIVHLDGLNLSRAWCMYGLIPQLSNKKYKKIMLLSAEKHLRMTIPNVASKHYEGSHWLASFVVYALSVEQKEIERAANP